jgi:eukaryotic-like serine/threonine-protein kinase
MPLKTDEKARFEGYVLDRTRWQLSWNGEPITLSPKTFDLLLYLIDHRGQVHGKDALLEALWPKQVVEESNLTQQVFLLRKALSRHESGAKIIETIPGRGYRFAAELEPLPSRPVDQGLADEEPVVVHEHLSVTRVTIDEQIDDPPAPALAPPRPRFMLGWRSWTALAALAAAGLYGWHYWQTAAAGPALDVVLADFDNNTGDNGLERPLNDALRIDLRQSPHLTVLSPGRVNATLGEMLKPPNSAVTPALAREICERNHAQVVLQGSLSKFGQNYLVSLRGSNCLSGDLVAEDKDEVSRVDDLPQALDALAAKVRRGLGESRASIRRFDQPLFPRNTGSLAALKAYSEGERQILQGNMPDALPLLKRATDLDPQFASAYLELSNAYGNLGDQVHEREAIGRAYALRNTATETDRFYIEAHYYAIVGDSAQSIHTLKSWAALYPRNTVAWAQLANSYTEIGQPTLAVEPGKRALALNDKVQGIYIILAVAQLRSGELQAAKSTCELAISRNLDGPDLRHVLLQTLSVLHDAAGVASQLDWGRRHNAPVLLFDEVFLALKGGEIHRTRGLLETLGNTDLPAEMTELRQSFAAVLARGLAEEGLTADSLRLLDAIPPAALDATALVALAEDGAVVRAREGLGRELEEHGNETLWKNERAPQIQAAMLLAEHKPQDAVRVLDAALPFDALTLGTAYLRGHAYLALGQSDQALLEFEKVARHESVEPLSSEYPLALLEMARIYAKKSAPDKARAAYRQFFEVWPSADSDLPIAQAARLELAGLAH